MFKKLVSFENLLSASRKAAKHCRKTQEITKFFFNLEKEIFKLQAKIINGTYEPCPYQYFTIHDPKKRLIAVAPFKDRVVHHAVVNMLEPLFEKCFIFDSYASRKGKGTHKAIKLSQQFIRKRPWYVKIDIEKYFDSINHAVLMKLVQKKIKDKKVLLLIQKIVGRSAAKGKGLPIGNLTSQFFANVYLDNFDHYIKDGLGIKCYLRYMDDFLIFGWSKKQVELRLHKAQQYLGSNLDLKINNKALYLGQSKCGISYLGRRIYPGVIRVRAENKNRSLKRINKKIKLWKINKINDDVLISSMNSVIAHLDSFSNLRCATGLGV
ncbi:MAG: reverse transcriptase/maturase family protein [Desulfobacula sp.]|nr:reverse transcriptase/maturase family protein [Desulfobacula sp.]